MTPLVFVVVLGAAAIHAGWNALLKGASDSASATLIIASVSALISLLALPFVPPPAGEAVPWLVASAAVQFGYYVLLGAAYRSGDLSRTYPIMRGLAPIFLVIPATLWLAEPISPSGWVGILLVCGGVASLLFATAGGKVVDARYAIATAAVIATYTLIDGIGIRLAHSPAYTLWLFLLTGAAAAAWGLATRRDQLSVSLRSNGLRLAIAGAGNLASYSLVLWAMTSAPIPLVAALRETSIIFGTVIAAIALHERVPRTRFIAVGVIAVGAAMLRFG